VRTIKEVNVADICHKYGFRNIRMRSKCFIGGLLAYHKKKKIP